MALSSHARRPPSSLKMPGSCDCEGMDLPTGGPFGMADAGRTEAVIQGVTQCGRRKLGQPP